MSCSINIVKKVARNLVRGKCYKRVIERNPIPIDRIEIPFEGKTLYGILHLPGLSGKFPVVLLGPGMDMFKEDWHACRPDVLQGAGVRLSSDRRAGAGGEPA